jgi:hypothetical protein
MPSFAQFARAQIADCRAHGSADDDSPPAAITAWALSIRRHLYTSWTKF